MTPEMLMSLKAFLPELTLVGFLSALFLLDGFVPKLRENRFPLVWVMVSCLGAALATKAASNLTGPFFNGMVLSNGLSTFFRYFFFFSCGATAYLTLSSKEIDSRGRSEFSILLLCLTFGLSLMALSNHFLMLYIGIETVSIISFVLAGFSRESLRSNEASFKYLVYGAVSSGLMIFGISLIYGYTGTLAYPQIAEALVKNNGAHPYVFYLALFLVYAGFAYKISSFPFHFWTPDVYEGAPTPVATFFSVGPKAAGFGALLHFILTALSQKDGNGQWTMIPGIQLAPILAVLSATTMVVGNLSAIAQTNVKRILAFSSIAHVGYVLMGFVVMTPAAFSSIIFYLIVYCAMNLGAFWVVGIVTDLQGNDDVSSFRGLGWNMPFLGVCMAIFLFSLTGIPLFSGFIGKFLLFGALIQVPGYLWLALLGVLNSVVSLYYYMKILKAMWLERPEGEVKALRLPLTQIVGLLGLAVPTIVLGLFFSPVLELAQKWVAQ
ncbi:MAG: NADH-quinone oxidoreductase subunit N [Proteobacteria bacterium]|nr:NADH-quinone oxidoreductase subunit N [Pseudomonadota bacterium]NDG26022.1 NADH-quinone oxidoreductase subunit N [Pseudomonadota bacterium]